MPFRALAVAALLLLAAAAPAQQGVQLRFQDGRVTLRAQNAPVRTILAEWARLGGATIVNADRVVGPPVTLELTGVPERQALDIVLRSVAGYLLAPRRAGASGASAFDRIMILPTSVAPRNPPPPAAAARARPGPGLVRPPVLARPPETALIEPPDMPQPEDVGGEPNGQPVQQRPVPGQPRTLPQPLVRPPVTMTPGAGPELVPPDDDDEDEDDPSPGTGQPGVATTPGNPFGVPAGSSTTPGVVAPAPRPQAPTNRVQ